MAETRQKNSTPDVETNTIIEGRNEITEALRSGTPLDML